MKVLQFRHNAEPNMTKYTITLDNRIMQLRVLQSAAGYYIGTMEYDPDLGCDMPYSRESVEYYRTEAEAKKALDHETWTKRTHY